MIKILGNPISVNALYRGGRRFLTSRGAEVKKDNAWEAKRQWKKPPLSGKIALNVRFYFADNRRHDIDNCLKALFDSLTGIVWVDDSQIYELHVFKSVKNLEPRVEIEVI